MTTDPFTEAARAEAHRYHWELREGGDLYYPPLDFGQHMAEWARDRLAAQEPTDSEVEAAANAILALTDETEETAHMDDIDVAWDHARAALSAARREPCAECGRTDQHKFSCSHREGRGATIPARRDEEDRP